MTWCGSCCRGEPECMLHPRSIHPPPPPPPPPPPVLSSRSPSLIPSWKTIPSWMQCVLHCVSCSAEMGQYSSRVLRNSEPHPPIVEGGCHLCSEECFLLLITACADVPTPHLLCHLIKTFVWIYARLITQKESRSWHLIFLGRKGAHADTMSPPYSTSFTAEL